MPYDHQFGLFVQDEKGPLWRGFFADLNRAKQTAQELADQENCEFFVFNFKNFTEVARSFPAQPKRLTVAGSGASNKSPGQRVTDPDPEGLRRRSA